MKLGQPVATLRAITGILHGTQQPFDNCQTIIEEQIIPIIISHTARLKLRKIALEYALFALTLVALLTSPECGTEINQIERAQMRLS